MNKSLSRTGAGFAALASLLLLAFFLQDSRHAKPQASRGADGVIWAIGKADGSSIEFAPGSRDRLTFTLGQSVTEKDFAGDQSGSVAFDPAASGEKPYTIVFDLQSEPKGRYQLVLDLIYRSGAPQQVKVEVNEKKGIFPVRPEPKDDIDSNEANSMLLSKQRLVVDMEPSWLRMRGNRITITPLGLGMLSYDALALKRGDEAEASADGNPSLEPTIFFRKRGGDLVELCKLVIPFKTRFRKAEAKIRVGDHQVQRAVENPGYDFGVLEEMIELPALEQPAKAVIQMSFDGSRKMSEHDFVPARRWKLYVCPKIHNDVGYTDIQPHVNELDTRNTDAILEILSKYPFYKFNFETAWLVDNYLSCRTPEYRKRFLDWAAKGRAAVNAFYLNLLTGLCSGEELYRAMYFSYDLHKKHGVGFNFACLTDAPSHSWFLPTLLNDVGIRFFSNGSNQTRAPILQLSNLNENSPFYWEGMNGQRVVMWYSRSYSQLKRLTGPSFVDPISSYDYLKITVPQFLLRFMRQDYPFDAVMVYGAYVDNAAFKTGEAPLIKKWNEEYEYPKLIVASDAEYFEYIEKNFADRLPVYRGDAGSYWEDGAASTAQATRLNRHSQQVLPAAETISSFATLFEPRFRYPAEEFRQAWKNVLFYDEHTWGAHNSIRQPDREFVTRQWEVKESYAIRANLDARNLLARSLNRLCQQISIDGDTIFAFNLQNWTRTEPLEVEIDEGRYLVDLSTNRQVELDVVFQKDGYRRVRFIAEGVPPMGYKGYALRSLGAPAGDGQGSQKISGPTIESRYYRLTVDTRTGGIRSLYDKTENRELVDQQAPYRLNQYVYVTGGENSLIVDNVFGKPEAELKVDAPVSAEIVENVKTPLGQRIVVVARAKNTPKIRSEYLLYDGLKRVDIFNAVQKEEVRQKEAVYFAFPFSARQPKFEYQIQNGWARPNDDQLPGACREWFTTQNLVHVKDGGFSIAWATPDAPLITLTDINRGRWPTGLEIKNGHVFSYAMNNYWFTNYKAAQGGQFVFRYFITSGSSLGYEQLARFDAETRAPLIAYPYLSTFSAKVEQKDRPFQSASGSFMDLRDENLQVVLIKEAEDGDGYILRLREVAGRSGEAEVRFPALRIEEAYLCNGVEAVKRKLASTGTSVRFPYGPNQYVTLRLKAKAETRK